MTYKIFVLLAFAFTKIHAQDSIDFYLLLGQSNMAGRAEIRPADKEVLENVFLINDKHEFEPAINPLNRYSTIRKDDITLQRLGPGYYFGKELSNRINDSVVILVNARGGSEINKWTKGNEYGLYEATLNRIHKTISKNPNLNLKGVLWQQGESDSEQSDDYLPKLKLFIANLRQDLDQSNLPFFIGEMGKWNRSYDLVREQLLKVEDEIDNVYLITSEGLTNFDEHHFNSDSCKELGRRYAKLCESVLYATK